MSTKLRDSAPEKLKEILAHEKLKGKKLMQKIFKKPMKSLRKAQCEKLEKKLTWKFSCLMI